MTKNEISAAVRSAIITDDGGRSVYARCTNGPHSGNQMLAPGAPSPYWQCQGCGTAYAEDEVLAQQHAARPTVASTQATRILAAARYVERLAQ